MRVLLADSNHTVLHETLQKAGFECDLFYNKGSEELKSILPEYDILVLRSKFKVDRALLEKCPKLRCIGRVGAGMENIDLEFALSRGVLCLSVPEGNRDAVAEHAIGMLLMLLNNLKRADLEVRKGIWKRAENRGTEIMGKTIGIIGYGNTGSALAKKLSGFGCTLLAHDKYLKDFGNEFVKESTLDELYENCHIISLHLPLNRETQHYANEKFFHSFKHPVYFINTARGPCVKTEDLVKALKSGKVLGACLDVLEYESSSFEGTGKNEDENFKYLKDSDQVILSPHIAGWTHESNFKMSRGIADKIIEAFPLPGNRKGI